MPLPAGPKARRRLIEVAVRAGLVGAPYLLNHYRKGDTGAISFLSGYVLHSLNKDIEKGNIEIPDLDLGEIKLIVKEVFEEKE